MIPVEFLLHWYDGDTRMEIKRRGTMSVTPTEGMVFTLDDGNEAAWPPKYRVDEVEHVLFDAGSDVGIGSHHIIVSATRLRAGRRAS